MRIRLIIVLLLSCCHVANANPLFYKRIHFVDYIDETQEYIFYDSNSNTVCREREGVVYDREGHKIGTYTSESHELFEDRLYYNKAGKFLGTSRFLYSNSSLVAKLIFSDPSKKRVGVYSFKWSLGKAINFFLEGSQLRLTPDQ